MSVPESEIRLAQINLPGGQGAVSLRDHLESLLKHEREIRQAEKEAAKSALELQAAEYERRLDSLNHEHARTRETQATYMPRETFDNFLKEDKAWKERISEELAQEQGRRDAQAASMQRLIAFVGLVISALSIALRFI